MKPGKPLTFAVHGTQPVIGLPGNPVSASVAFEVFVKPGLRRMAGDPTPFPELRTVRIANAYPRSTGRMEFARARIDATAGGAVAHLHPRQNSGSLRSLTGVHALVVIPAEMEIVSAGTELSAILLGDPGRLAEAAPFAARV
jgi:molybdopterin molybdotransferase